MQVSTPPVPVHPVTALPGPGECSRTESSTDQASRPTGAEIQELAEKVSSGVVRVLAEDVSATGFVAGDSGLIVTHGLAVAGASGPRVETKDGEVFQGRVVGIDDASGLAYLEVRADRDLTPVSLGNSDEVCLGDDVIAVGFPGKDRPESPEAFHGKVTAARAGYFRIESTLDDGILGGPLLNAAGEVIGVSGSGIVIRDGVAENVVSFMIPINLVKGHIEGGLPDHIAPSADTPALLPSRTPQPPALPPPSPTAVVPAATPSPTPLPTATAVPTPTPLPTSTATPEPLPTATPAPTATPRATSRPRPTPLSRQVARPTPTPTPTPPPTATPLPPPTLPPTAGYRTAEIGYSIRHPVDWDVSSQRNGEFLRFTSPEGDAYLEVSVENVFSDWSLGELVDNYRQELGRQARNWESYEQVSATGEYREAVNYVHLEYRRQEEPGSCVEDVVTHLYRSRFFPAKMRGYAVTMSICDSILQEYSEFRETLLSTFREFRTDE